ncbi:MAG: beta-ketoacyl synthase N-terminal-like domain-containing protein, partial [Bacteroidota bacterium]
TGIFAFRLNPTGLLSRFRYRQLSAGSDLERSSSAGNDYPEIYYDQQERIPYVHLATADIGSIWAMLAAQEAVRQAQWESKEVQSPRTGVSIGSGSGGHVVQRHAWELFFQQGKRSTFTGSHNVDRTMVYREAANVSCLIKNKGICEGLSSACATGLSNIGYAYRMIKFGVQDRMICGGVEPTALETFIGFDAMRVLSRKFAPEKSSRPYDKDRNGFVCSFGCGIVALEEYELAKSRGAQILAVIDGYHNNADGDGDMFAPSFDGQVRLWQGLKAEVPSLRPDLVKAHSTSTPVGDAIELFSIVDQVGIEGYHISAPKSQFGHMLGAAGAVEFIVSVLMLQQQKVSPCLNLQSLNDIPETIQQGHSWQGTKEPLAAFAHLLPKQTLRKEIQQIVALNYGFGGTNGAIAISKDN